MATPANRSLVVEGVAETLRAFGQVDKGLRSELRAELVGLAAGVATVARQIAESKGLRRTGDLISRIRPGFRAGYAYISDPARHRGYNYPARLEFEKGGQRAFLRPAAKQEEGNVLVGLESMLDRLTSSAGLQKGGVL